MSTVNPVLAAPLAPMPEGYAAASAWLGEQQATYDQAKREERTAIEFARTRDDYMTSLKFEIIRDLTAPAGPEEDPATHKPLSQTAAEKAYKDHPRWKAQETVQTIAAAQRSVAEEQHSIAYQRLITARLLFAAQFGVPLAAVYGAEVTR